MQKGYYSHMKIASISETKNNLSAILDLVRNGETVLITDRNKPVARIEPIIPEKDEDEEARLQRLEAAGIIKRAKKAMPSKWFFEGPLPKLPHGVSAVQYLLDEREEGY